MWREPRDVALVVEVASPATAQYDAPDKQASYARAGIASYWRVDQDGTTHVLSLDGTSYRDVREVAAGDEWEATEPFAITLRPADWR